MRPCVLGGIALLSFLVQAACGPALPTAPLTPTAILSTATTAPPAQIASSAAWIELDIARQVVLLHQDGIVLAELPASSAATSDPKYASAPGAYRVQSRDKGPVVATPGVYVTDVVMFDIRLGNGFHSRPMDAQGNVLDATLGTPTTAGCVRVGESARLFDFAQVGMWVWIH